jgi:glucose/arabinose dehydrogenase
VYVPFGENGLPNGPPVPFLTGFVRDLAHAVVFGQPVGVLMTSEGHLLVADDAGDAVWKVSAKK